MLNSLSHASGRPHYVHPVSWPLFFAPATWQDADALAFLRLGAALCDPTAVEHVVAILDRPARRGPNFMAWRCEGRLGVGLGVYEHTVEEALEGIAIDRDDRVTQQWLRTRAHRHGALAFSPSIEPLVRRRDLTTSAHTWYAASETEPVLETLPLRAPAHYHVDDGRVVVTLRTGHFTPRGFPDDAECVAGAR